MADDAISRFESEYLTYHDVSPARRTEVVRHLRALEVLAGVPITEVGRDVFASYLLAQQEAGKVPATVGKIRGCLRPFFQWAWEAGLVPADTLMAIKAVRAPRGAAYNGKPRPYQRPEIAQMWSDWNRAFPFTSDGGDVERALYFVERWDRGTSKWGRVRPYAWRTQSRAIIACALMGAMRLTEIHSITVDELHPENAYITVRGARKNAEAEVKVRAVPWTTPEFRQYVQTWLDLRERLAPDHDSPWLSMHNVVHLTTPLPHRTFEMLLCTMGRGWEFHRLRHTAATEMLRSGYSLETVQKIMGHARIQQTLRYAELLPDDVVKVAGRHQENLSAALAAA